MKRILSVLMILSVILTFTACGGKKRELYNVNMEKYVELGEYKGISVDTDSEEYKEIYTKVIASDVIKGQYNSQEQKTEGIVCWGDIANINYVGKKNGVAFEGGTADNQDLTIGSGQFIAGFEEGLVGVEIGSTVDLNLTFPEDYGNEELNGAAVVFTVKVNYVKAAKTPEEFYSDAGYKTVEQYYENVKKSTSGQILIDKVMETAKVKDYPKKDYEFLLGKIVEEYEYQLEAYEATLEDYLKRVGQTEKEFKDELGESTIKPYMKEQMILYAIFDAAELSFTQEEISAAMEDEGVQEENKYYSEVVVVHQKVLDYLYKNAKIS